MHLQFASAALRMLDQGKSNYAGYMLARHIKPKKIVFHRPLLPHETCGMNQPQESHEHSQISSRKPLGRPIRFKIALRVQSTLE